MIVVPKVVVQDRVVDMVSADQMFESPGSFLRRCFDIVDLHGWEVDGLRRIRAGCEISVNSIDKRHPSYHRGRHGGRVRCVDLPNMPSRYCWGVGA